MQTIRRVVTGHDAGGRSMVLFDGPLPAFGSDRPGGSSALVWTDDNLPADNRGAADAALLQGVPTALPDGSVFRVLRYAPGVAPRQHRTQSLDYAVVLSGSIDMELDEGTVTLHAGDLLVQRGTIHNWINRGAEDCVVAFVLIGARLLAVDGRALTPTG